MQYLQTWKVHIIKYYLIIYSVQAKIKQLELLEKQFELLKWEYENKQERFDKLVSERDELKSRFSRAIQEVQQKAAFKTDSLEIKVMNLESKVGEPHDLAVSCVTVVQLFSESCREYDLPYKGKFWVNPLSMTAALCLFFMNKFAHHIL